MPLRRGRARRSTARRTSRAARAPRSSGLANDLERDRRAAARRSSVRRPASRSAAEPRPPRARPPGAPADGRGLAGIHAADRQHRVLGPHRLVDERLVLVHIRLQVPHPGGRSPTRACGLSGPGTPPPGQPSLGDLDGRHGARGSAHAFEPCLWSGCDRSRWCSSYPARREAALAVGLEHARSGRSGETSGDAPGSTASRPAGATLSSITITVRVRPCACATSRGGVVHVGDRDGVDAVFDRGAREPVVREHEVGGQVVEHPIHRVPAVGVRRALASSVSIATPSRYRIRHGWGGRRRATCPVRRVRGSSRRRRAGAGPPRCTGARAPPGDPSPRSLVRGGAIASANRSPASRHASRTRSGSTGTGPVVAAGVGLEPGRPADEAEDPIGSSAAAPSCQNCLSGSPSCSSRMLRSTLSSGWLSSGPATIRRAGPRAAPRARPGPGSSGRRARGRRAACDPITSIDPIVRGAQR